jgi:hypothetical protein
VQFDVADLAAGVMPVQDRRPGFISQPFVAPADHHHQHLHQVQALLGEQVLIPDGTGRVLTSREHTGPGQPPEPLSQHFPRNTEALLQLIEPADADVDVPNDQGGPWLAGHVHGARDRARHRAELGALHKRILTPAGSLKKLVVLASSYEFP